MQTVKATLFILICVTLLSACGLKGPLYLEDGKPAAEFLSEHETTADEEKMETPENSDDKKSDLS